MITKYKNLINSFFAHRLTSQVRELYSSVLILDFAISAVNLFEPIFLFLLFLSRYGAVSALSCVLIFYLAVYIIYFFCVPLGAKFAKRFGYEYSIAVSTIFTILFYWFLFASQRHYWLIAVAVVMYVFDKMFYWPAYHGDFARYSTEGEQGREVGNLIILLSLVFVLGPLAGGFILKFYGFGALFFIASILILLSNIPLLITKEQFTPTGFSYGGAMKRLFAKNNRRKLFAHFGFGEELIDLVVWPIFIYMVVKDFFNLGALIAISTMLTSVVCLFIGRIVDKRDRRLVLRYGTVIYFFSWLFRLLTRSIAGVFLVDSYSRITKQVIGIPLVAATYKEAQDGSVMNTIVFFEMSLVLGKIIAMVLALILLQFFVPGWNVIFILAGVMTLFYLLF